MPTYATPLRDIRFVFDDVLGIPAHYADLEGGDAFSPDLVAGIMDEAARFTQEVLQPLNQTGDVEGCTFENGTVRTPAGFKAAYRQYAEGGWCGTGGDAAYGGMDLPATLEIVAEEMTTTANMAFAMYPGLSHGAIHALEQHGSEAQKQLYLPPLLSGAWSGTMCLTEPHAGSDVGLLRTRAEPQADGSYRITGNKIFISAGEHDLTDNIVHLVLARTPGAPAGTKGISLFIVPKFLPDADGRPGERNALACGAIERKMGIHANATCQMNFDGAVGWLIGEENRGMKAMFTMMNAARLTVGLQGLGLAEGAWQASRDYALERLQLRAPGGPANPDGPADPIVAHPDVRRMLLTQRAFVMGGRALVYFTAQQADLLNRARDPETRAAGRALVDLLTPIAKAFLTETALESTNHALQIFGGHGYIADNGMEQFVRDCRITLIYEGTTQIQALDLLGRKVMLDGGRTLSSLCVRMRDDLDTVAAGGDDLAGIAAAVRPRIDDWERMAQTLGERTLEAGDTLGAGAVDFLMVGGYTLYGWLWARLAAAAPDDDYGEGLRKTAQFYVARILPRVHAHRSAGLACLESLMAITPAELTA